MRETIQVYIFPSKFYFFFYLFQVMWKAHSQLSRNYSTSSRIVCGHWPRYSRSTRMCGMIGDCRTTSSDLEIVGQGQQLPESLFLSCYTTDFYQTFTEMMALQPATKISYQLTLKIQVKVTIYKNQYISTIIQPILTNLSRKCYYD